VDFSQLLTRYPALGAVGGRGRVSQNVIDCREAALRGGMRGDPWRPSRFLTRLAEGGCRARLHANQVSRGGGQIDRYRAVFRRQCRAPRAARAILETIVAGWKYRHVFGRAEATNTQRRGDRAAPRHRSAKRAGGARPATLLGDRRGCPGRGLRPVRGKQWVSPRSGNLPRFPRFPSLCAARYRRARPSAPVWPRHRKCCL
jgi:hypothetical protein